jgi:hypothetical protein
MMQRGAEFDPTGCYRYSLWRKWSEQAPSVTFIMLNPSTADAMTDDPTIRRCIRFAQTWGFGSLEVVNLFAYRSTHWQDLRQATDPVGEENDRYLTQAIRHAQITLVAWGNWGTLQSRSDIVLQLFSQHQNFYCLGTTKLGQPRHPLYVRSDVAPITFCESA